MMRNGDYSEQFLRGVREIAEGLDRDALDRAIEMLFAAWQRGSTIFTCGNGGSAGTATHLAADLFKCTIVETQPRLRARWVRSPWMRWPMPSIRPSFLVSMWMRSPGRSRS